jgi:hypothetical protein
MTAHLSDNSAPDYSDTSLNSTGTALRYYTFTYNAASTDQTLTITFTQVSATTGNVLLQAAALSGGAGPPDFSLSATPATQTAMLGGSAAYNLTVSALNGFTGSVGFAISGLPTGVTAAFSPASLSGGGSSTLTLTASASAASGTYPLTVTGTSGNLSRSASINLSINGAPDFALAATPASRSVPPGGSVGYTLNVSNLNGFSGTVGFSVVGLPSNATAIFTPATVSVSGACTLNVTTGTGTSVGNYPLIIMASSGAISRTANVTLSVTPPPDFSISATPSSRSVLPGGSAGYTLTLQALNGFAGTVALSVAGLPFGASASFSPATLTAAGTSTMTLSTTAGTAAGTYSLAVTGSSGVINAQPA